MPEGPKQGRPHYDLLERCLEFARRVRVFLRTIPRTQANHEDGKQLIRSSGSVGANYLEANEALSKKDFVMRLKIARKEAKESAYWFSLIDTGPSEQLDRERKNLRQEVNELKLILNAMITKVEAGS